MILVESEMYMYEEMPVLPEFFFSSFLRDRIFVSIRDELISVLHRSYVGMPRLYNVHMYQFVIIIRFLGG